MALNLNSSSSLFQPLSLGLVEKSGCFSNTILQQPILLPNRISMAAMSRGRCSDEKNIPNDLHAQYYSQRASAGFIVTESIPISDRSLAYPASASIYTDEQMQGWKSVVDKVHAAKGIIFAQLFHCGRQTHSKLQDGKIPWAPSPVKLRGENQIVKTEYEIPHEMTIQEIQEVLQQFKAAATRAKKAGFDGIEVNGGHGHLVDQFLRDSSNKRTDSYGGSIQNRCRFTLELANILIGVFGAGRIGFKFTPVSHHADMSDSNPVPLFQHLLRELSTLRVAYVVLKQDSDKENHLDFGYKASKAEIPCVYQAFRRFFNGVVVGNGELTIEQAEEDIKLGKYDVAQFGRLYVSNPDLVERARQNYQIEKNIDWSTAFHGQAKGYTDYPTLKSIPEYDSLFVPLKLNDLVMANRITMSAMGRLRCSDPAYIPNKLIATYYGQRAKAGLIVTESVPVSKRSNAYPNSPCIYSDEQAKGWEQVVETVHNKGGKIFIQLFHSGRQTHSELQQGLPAWAPSAIAIRNKCQMNQKDFEVPHEMSVAEIQQTQKEYVDGAKRAKLAGFDGIELNGGHGHLIDQFLRDSANKRNDNYGGSIENRCRFVLELINQLNSVYPGRIALKVTPLAHTGDMFDSDPVKLYTYLFQQLNKLNIKLAYITLKEDDDKENTDGYGYKASKEQVPDIIGQLKPHFSGNLFLNNHITPERAAQDISKGIYHAVSFGKLFINNPDLVFRIRNGFELNTAYDFATFFGGAEKGYTDFPLYEEWIKNK